MSNSAPTADPNANVFPYPETPSSSKPLQDPASCAQATIIQRPTANESEHEPTTSHCNDTELAHEGEAANEKLKATHTEPPIQGGAKKEGKGEGEDSGIPKSLRVARASSKRTTRQKGVESKGGSRRDIGVQFHSLLYSAYPDEYLTQLPATLTIRLVPLNSEVQKTMAVHGLNPRLECKSPLGATLKSVFRSLRQHIARRRGLEEVIGAKKELKLAPDSGVMRGLLYHNVLPSAAQNSSPARPQLQETGNNAGTTVVWGEGTTPPILLKDLYIVFGQQDPLFLYYYWDSPGPSGLQSDYYKAKAESDVLRAEEYESLIHFLVNIVGQVDQQLAKRRKRRKRLQPAQERKQSTGAEARAELKDRHTEQDAALKPPDSGASNSHKTPKDDEEVDLQRPFKKLFGKSRPPRSPAVAREELPPVDLRLNCHEKLKAPHPASELSPPSEPVATDSKQPSNVDAPHLSDSSVGPFRSFVGESMLVSGLQGQCVGLHAFDSNPGQTSDADVGRSPSSLFSVGHHKLVSQSGERNQSAFVSPLGASQLMLGSKSGSEAPELACARRLHDRQRTNFDNLPHPNEIFPSLPMPQATDNPRANDSLQLPLPPPPPPSTENRAYASAAPHNEPGTLLSMYNDNSSSKELHPVQHGSTDSRQTPGALVRPLPRPIPHPPVYSPRCLPPQGSTLIRPSGQKNRHKEGKLPDAN